MKLDKKIEITVKYDGKTVAKAEIDGRLYSTELNGGIYKETEKKRSIFRQIRLFAKSSEDQMSDVLERCA